MDQPQDFNDIVFDAVDEVVAGTLDGVNTNNVSAAESQVVCADAATGRHLSLNAYAVGIDLEVFKRPIS